MDPMTGMKNAASKPDTVEIVATKLDGRIPYTFASHDLSTLPSVIHPADWAARNINAVEM
jgi:hypothetical protein